MFILYSLSWACIKLSLLSSWDLRDTVSPFHAFVPSHSTWYLGLDRCNPKRRAFQVGPISSGEKKLTTVCLLGFSLWFPICPLFQQFFRHPNAPWGHSRQDLSTIELSQLEVISRAAVPVVLACSYITSTWWHVTPDLRTPLPALVLPSSGSPSPPIVIPSQLEAISRALNTPRTSGAWPVSGKLIAISK
jgi:hypothetical protein